MSNRSRIFGQIYLCGNLSCGRFPEFQDKGYKECHYKSGAQRIGAGEGQPYAVNPDEARENQCYRCHEQQWPHHRYN